MVMMDDGEGSWLLAAGGLKGLLRSITFGVGWGARSWGSCHGTRCIPFPVSLLPTCCAMRVGLLLCNGGCSLWTLRFLRRKFSSQRHSSKFLGCHGENVAELSKVQTLCIIVVVCRLIQIVAFVVVRLLIGKVIIIFIAFADWLHRLTCIISTCNIDSGGLRPTFPARIHSGRRARKDEVVAAIPFPSFPFPAPFCPWIGGAPRKSGYCKTKASEIDSMFKDWCVPTRIILWASALSPLLSKSRAPNASES